MSPPGTVVLSIDAELGWGFHHLDVLPVERIRTARAGWRRLVDLLDEYRVPATWAIVGHLLLEACERPHHGHPAGERPCTRGGPDLPPAVSWFAGDLVDAVRDAAVDHELAAHGFTHVHFQHECMSPEFAARELSSTLDAAARVGFQPTTFVFPVNRPAYRSLLAAHGFECYRGPDPDPGPGGRQLEKLEAAVGRGAPPIVHPEVDEYGLVDVPGSGYLFGFEGLGRRVVEPAVGDPIVGSVRRGLDRLAVQGGVLHLWLHPHNLQTDRDVERLQSVLELVRRRRSRGDVRVETMATVAARVGR